MSGDGNFQWWHAPHKDSEVWNGPEPSREAAIQAGTVDYDGEPFAIFEADKSVCEPRIDTDWLVEKITEDLVEKNEECWGEDGAREPWSDDALNDLGNALDEMVTAWLARHPAKTWSAGDIRVMETIKPEKLAP